MKSTRSRYHGHRFPPEIIGYAVWVYHRLCLSFRDVEDLLAERGIIVSYEAIRRWCWKFGPDYARRLKKKRLSATIRWEARFEAFPQRCFWWRLLRHVLGDDPDMLLCSIKLYVNEAARRLRSRCIPHVMQRFMDIQVVERPFYFVVV